MTDAKFDALPCCGYQCQDGAYPVKWNAVNKVAQCHNCGQVWEPRVAIEHDTAAGEPVAWNDVWALMKFPWIIGYDNPPPEWKYVNGKWIAPDNYKSPFYLRPALAAVPEGYMQVSILAIDRMMRDCEHGSRIWKELDAIAKKYRLAAIQEKP